MHFNYWMNKVSSVLINLEISLLLLTLQRKRGYQYMNHVTWLNWKCLGTSSFIFTLNLFLKIFGFHHKRPLDGASISHLSGHQKCTSGNFLRHAWKFGISSLNINASTENLFAKIEQRFSQYKLVVYFIAEYVIGKDNAFKTYFIHRQVEVKWFRNSANRTKIHFYCL